MNLKAKAVLIALAGIAAATAILPFGGPSGAAVGGGWVVSILTAVLAIGPLAKAAWAQGVSDPEDPARVAFKGAVVDDVMPLVAEEIDAADAHFTLLAAGLEADLRDAKTKMGDLDAQRQRVESELAAIRAEITPGIQALQPLARVVRVKMEDGTEKDALALQLTLNSTVEAINGLIDWISQPDTNLPGLGNTFQTALERAKEYDVMAAMGAKGNEAQRQNAEKLGIQAAQKLQWMQAHPDMAQAGVELQQAEDALGEILAMMGVKDGAIKSYAMGAAKRQLAGQAMGGTPGFAGGSTANRPVM